MLLTEENVEKIKETMRIRAARPVEVQWQEMVDRGWIDQDGNVLLKRPEWGGQMYPGQPRPARGGEPGEPA